MKAKNIDNKEASPNRAGFCYIIEIMLITV